MPPKLDIKQTSDFAWLLKWLESGAIVAKTLSTKKAKTGDPIVELTSLDLPAGSWVIAGQGTFSVTGSSDSSLEYRLFLRYTSGETTTIGQHAYMRIQGGSFGSPIVIDAVTFDSLTTVELVYLPESINQFASPQTLKTDVKGQILIAIKTSSLFVYG